MSPAFINTNHHEVYIRDPERDDDRTSEASGLLRVAAESEFTVSGKRLVEETESVPGVFKSDSKEAKEFTKKGGVFEQRDLMRSTPGPVAAGPVPEEERTAERSGLHITGKDSGMPVANTEAEPGDVKDGSGEDKFEGVAAVRNGEVERGDVPAALADEPTTETPGDLSELSAKEVRKLAAERNIKGRSKMKTPELIAAMQAPAGEGGGGGVATQTESASETVESEAVGEPGGTLTTADDPSAGAVGEKPKRQARKRSRSKGKSKSRAKRKKGGKS